MTAQSVLEIKSRGESEPAAGDCVVGLVRSRRIGGGESAKVNVVNVRAAVYKVPPRVVHDAECVNSKFEFLPFRDSDTFHKVYIEVCVSRGLDPLAAEGAHGSGRWIG